MINQNLTAHTKAPKEAIRGQLEIANINEIKKITLSMIRQETKQEKLDRTAAAVTKKV